AIGKASGIILNLTGAGRTDAGVHATAQVAHFDLADFPSDELFGALNHYVKPHPISILKVEEVDAEFHARFSATSRSYVYKILNRLAPPAIDVNRVWHVKEPLDEKAMHEAAQVLIGTHDFSSFRAAPCQAKSPIRTVTKLVIDREGELIRINITAPSFLHNQVRIIVGNLREIGNGKISKADLQNILQAKDRTIAKQTAPATGLYMCDVAY
ncbi:MAG: tRNA pseudouridine(38-40) synthase TruA, partial [Gammaproteobacteria bacterium]